MTFVRPLFVTGFSRFVHGSMGDSRASLGLRPSFVLASPGSSADTLADQRQCGLDPRQGLDNLSHGINKVKIDAMSRAGQTQQGAAVAVMQGTIRPARLRCVAGHGSIADLPGGGGFVGFGHSFPPVFWMGMVVRGRTGMYGLQVVHILLLKNSDFLENC